MSFRVWYDPFVTDLTSYELTQRFKPSLKITPNVVRANFVMFNVPTITALNCRIYSESMQSNGTYSVGKLIDSSAARTVSTITTIKNGVYDLYFQFSNGSFLNENSYYYITFTATGYTFSESSHLGWLRDWPEPNYGTGSEYSDVLLSPYRFHLNGQRFSGI